MRVRRALQTNPIDRAFGDVLAHVVIVATLVRHHRCGLVEHRWLVLAGLRTQDSVETFEAQAGWPTIERPGERLLVRRRQVPLAECAGGVSVLAKNLHERGGFLGDDAVVTRKRTCTFGDVAHVHRVVVATSQHCSARGRAQRGGVELVESQTIRRNTVECGRGNRPAERAARSKAHVVEQYQHDVGRIR